MIGTVKAGSPEHKRFLQEWLSPDQRPMCKNCQHVKYRDKPLNYKGQFTGCGLGGFETHKTAVCRQWGEDKAKTKGRQVLVEQ